MRSESAKFICKTINHASQNNSSASNRVIGHAHIKLASLQPLLLLLLLLLLRTLLPCNWRFRGPALKHFHTSFISSLLTKGISHCTLHLTAECVNVVPLAIFLHILWGIAHQHMAYRYHMSSGGCHSKTAAIDVRLPTMIATILRASPIRCVLPLKCGGSSIGQLCMLLL